MRASTLSSTTRWSLAVLIAISIIGCGGKSPPEEHIGGTGGQGGGGGPGRCHSDAECAEHSPDSCRIAVCNDGSHEGPVGECVVIPAAAGTACDDGLFCTVGDACDGAGFCVGGAPNECGLEATACARVVCDELAARCSLLRSPNGTDCSAGDRCQPATCEAGECIAAPPKDCSAMDSGCVRGACNPTDGACEAVPLDLGTSCGPAGPSQCEVLACDGAGACAVFTAPDGTACSTGRECSMDDACVAGMCTGTIDEVACQAAATFLHEGFENCGASGWTFGGEWQCGAPTSGPNAARTGSGCLATNLSGPYATDASFATSVATSPVIDLGSATNPRLTFWAWVDTEAAEDVVAGFNVKIRNAGDEGVDLPFDVTPRYDGWVFSQPVWGGLHGALGWQRYAVELRDWIGERIQVELGFASDGDWSYDGVYIDDLSITESFADPLSIDPADLAWAQIDRPYTAELHRQGGTAEATWSIVGGSNHPWLSIDPSSGVLSGTPAASNLGRVELTVRIDEPALSSNFAEVVLAFDVRRYPYGIYFEEDFSSCAGGWSLQSDWQCGTPSGVGPACHSAPGCLATNLTGPYRNGLNWGTAVADSPSIDLTDAAEPMLWFWAWVQTDSFFGGAIYDGFHVEVSADDGLSWSLPTEVSPAYHASIGGQSGWGGDRSAQRWERYAVSLADYAGQTIRLRFAFFSDATIDDLGVYIDDLLVADRFTVPVWITTARLANAFVGRPYAYTVERRGGSSGARWSLGADSPPWMEIDAATGELRGTPGPGDQGWVNVTVRVEEPLNPENFITQSLLLRVIELPTGQVFAEDFEGGPSGWTLTGKWTWGGPANGGPPSCHSGGSCLVSVNPWIDDGGSRFDDSTATSQMIDLSGLDAPLLNFWAWVSTATVGQSLRDGFNVKASPDGGATWTLLTEVAPAYDGTLFEEGGLAERAWGGDRSAQGWERYSVDLSAFAGQQIRLRFAFHSETGGELPGVHLDDLVVFDGVPSWPDPVPDVPSCGFTPASPQPTAQEATGRLRGQRWGLCTGTSAQPDAAGIEFTQGTLWHFLRRTDTGSLVVHSPEARGTQYTVVDLGGTLVVYLTWADEHQSRAVVTFSQSNTRMRLDFENADGSWTSAWYTNVG
ncbi:hypothetical protein [Vulgatibacter incomptus]|uniref:Uncharacterized protein n=1 Tax=Vulgatibacter incomptus TaxID=1391653 RepID=A0A0K1PHP8_9BACT|nr:hypothetical protein [Vulgatibacter incomptus]AKU92926.1 hypothetical protein AKJ08_3313 [Vulgatibacter incomptus]